MLDLKKELGERRKSGKRKTVINITLYPEDVEFLDAERKKLSNSRGTNVSRGDLLMACLVRAGGEIKKKPTAEDIAARNKRIFDKYGSWSLPEYAKDDPEFMA